MHANCCFFWFCFFLYMRYRTIKLSQAVRIQTHLSVRKQIQGSVAVSYESLFNPDHPSVILLDKTGVFANWWSKKQWLVSTQTFGPDCTAYGKCGSEVHFITACRIVRVGMCWCYIIVYQHNYQHNFSSFIYSQLGWRSSTEYTLSLLNWVTDYIVLYIDNIVLQVTCIVERCFSSIFWYY